MIEARAVRSSCLALSIVVVRFAFLGSVGLGCSLQRLAVDQTAGIIVAAAPAIQQEGDFEYARQALPAGLVQVQGLWQVAPDNEDLLLQLASGYAAYALVFLEDEMEAAADDPDEYARRERRVTRFFLRSRRYGLRLVEQQNEGFRAALKGGHSDVRAYLSERDEDDVPALFWTSYAWGAAIGHSLDDIELIADIPTVLTLMERVAELDGSYQGGGVHTFLGSVYAGIGEAVGGDPEKGKRHFEKALRQQRRRDLLALVQYAKTYCVNTQNREKFRALLREVIDAPDYRENRLVNTAAKRRARRLLAREDELFY